MKKYVHRIFWAMLIVLAYAPCVMAQETAAAPARTPLTPFAIGIIMGLAALGGTTAQGRAISAGLESIGRNPSAAGKIQTPMMVGLAFIESLVILSFVICFLLL